MKLYRMNDLVQVLDISRWSVYRLIDAGKFPKPLRLGNRTPRWPADEVDQWLQERHRERFEVRP